MAFILAALGIGAMMHESLPDQAPQVLVKLVHMPDNVAGIFKKGPPSDSSYHKNKAEMKAKYTTTSK